MKIFPPSLPPVNGIANYFEFLASVYASRRRWMLLHYARISGNINSCRICGWIVRWIVLIYGLL